MTPTNDTSGPTNNLASRPSRWARLRSNLHQRDVWIAVVCLAVGALLTVLLAEPSAQGILAHKSSVIKAFDSKAGGGLQVLDAQGHAINEDVYVVETTVANVGNVPFDVVRRPVEIRFSDGRVIETRVNAASERDVSKFTASTSGLSTVRLHWSVFDPGQWAKITSLIASEKEVKPEVAGWIYGANISPGRISKLPASAEYFVLAIVIVFTGVLAFLALVSLIETVTELRKRAFRDAIPVAVFTIAMGFFAWRSALVLYQLWTSPAMPL